MEVTHSVYSKHLHRKVLISGPKGALAAQVALAGGFGFLSAGISRESAG